MNVFFFRVYYLLFFILSNRMLSFFFPLCTSKALTMKYYSSDMTDPAACISPEADLSSSKNTSPSILMNIDG